VSNISVNTITDASGGSTASINGLTPQASNMQPLVAYLNRLGSDGDIALFAKTAPRWGVLGLSRATSTLVMAKAWVSCLSRRVLTELNHV
jgi:hypothetical protein